MKTAKLSALILVAALLLCLFTGCGQAPADTPTEDNSEVSTAVTVTDMTGREISLDAPAERVVALTAADCEILYALGCGDTLIGRGTYCNYPVEVLEVPEVESGSLTNIEQIIALSPDVLFMGDMDQTEAQVAQLENAGVRVVVSDAHNIEGTYTAIGMIGTIMGKDAEATALIDDMKATFAELQAKAEANSVGEKTVYFEVSPLEWGLWAAGAGTFMDEIGNMIGLKNCFADVDDWGSVSEEQVLSRDPDYIVTVAMFFGEGPTPVEEILSRPGWENLTAIKNDAVLNLANDELTRPGPRLAEGAQMLYDFVYGTTD